MEAIIDLVKDLGYPIIIISALMTFGFLGVFVWFAKHIFDEFKRF